MKRQAVGIIVGLLVVAGVAAAACGGEPSPPNPASATEAPATAEGGSGATRLEPAQVGETQEIRYLLLDDEGAETEEGIRVTVTRIELANPPCDETTSSLRGCDGSVARWATVELRMENPNDHEVNRPDVELINASGREQGIAYSGTYPGLPNVFDIGNLAPQSTVEAAVYFGLLAPRVDTLDGWTVLVKNVGLLPPSGGAATWAYGAP